MSYPPSFRLSSARRDHSHLGRLRPSEALTITDNTHPTWWRDPGLRKNVLHCGGLCLCVFYLGYDQSLLACLQSIPQWNSYFDTPSGVHLGLISSSLYFPGIPAAFVGSWISMKFGRRPAVWAGSFLIIIGAIVNALSKNAGEFSGGRVLIGAGGAMTKVVAPALLQEIAHPRLRSVLASSYYGWFFLGAIVSGYLCRECWDQTNMPTHSFLRSHLQSAASTLRALGAGGCRALLRSSHRSVYSPSLGLLQSLHAYVMPRVTTC